jgi:hypothetical protein
VGDQAVGVAQGDAEGEAADRRVVEPAPVEVGQGIGVTVVE